MIALPRGAWAAREGGDIIFYKEKPSFDSVDGEFSLEMGETELPEFNCRIEVSLCDKAKAEQLIAEGLPADSLLIPAENLSELRIRARKDGDVIAASGMEGHKKLKKLFAELNLPLARRANWPLLILKDEIIWVCGLRRGRLLPPAEENLLIRYQNGI